MKPLAKIILIAVLLWSGSLIIYSNTQEIWEGLFYYVSFIKYFIFFGVFIFSLVSELTKFQETKNWKNFAITPIGLVLFVVISFQLYSIVNINNSKTILEISHIPAANNVLTIELKENDNFIITEHSMLGSTIFYGTYSFKNNQIQLLTGNHKNCVIPFNAIGQLENDTVYWQNFDTMIIEK